MARQFATPLGAQAVATSRRRDGASASADGRARLGFVADDRAGSSAYFVCKRVLDVVVAILLGILVVPLVPIVVLAIKIDSPGPALFRQERVRGRRVRKGDTTGWEVVPVLAPQVPHDAPRRGHRRPPRVHDGLHRR
ncbi:MAG: hypothetical protein KatS3mg010_2094 [Acidimicrobiia bacterium]|nr:MAG: hypothetical protein KatS3mg010_2094 [Acidimicrobiia bacterium]